MNIVTIFCLSLFAPKLTTEERRVTIRHSVLTEPVRLQPRPHRRKFQRSRLFHCCTPLFFIHV